MVADHQSGRDQGGITEHASAGAIRECESIPGITELAGATPTSGVI